MLEISDLAAFLRGSWRIERTVLDRRHGLSGAFRGVVEFALADGGLGYHESGTLDWAGSQTPATRQYFLQHTGNPAELTWHFVNQDGSRSYFFHSMNLQTGSWRANHPCAADVYRVEYTVGDRENLSVVWDVVGPSKNQLLSSSWQRLG